MPDPTALITGVAGQDGVFLARLLRADGLRVVGTASPGSASLARNGVYLDGVEVVPLDVRDGAGIAAVVADTAPDVIYNLAALSSVGQSWEQPELTRQVNTDAVEHLVAAALALRDRTGRDVRFLQASSAEVRGAGADSPYARSKAAAEEIVRAARADHGLHASCGILFNHESPLRAVRFVTRKITRAAAEIALGRRDSVTLGNLDVRRDWGFAGDHVAAMRLLAEGAEPLDVEIGTGVAHSLGDLLDVAFEAAGAGDAASYVVVDPALVRPVDAAVTVADPEPARRLLGWEARTTFAEVVRHMVEVDLIRLRSGVEDSAAYLAPPTPPR